jgi:SAM-dependent methyltransferase
MINQDKVYLDKEADDFFKRNKYDFNKLPYWKQELVDNFSDYLNEKEITNVLEIGCQIGDLLDYSVKKFNAIQGYGLEPSSEAVEEGKKRFSQTCRLMRGIAAHNEIFENIPACDLVIINDVFSWISRASILRSIANIDEHISDNGYLIIRDYVPHSFVRNQNRHVDDHEVFCHKIIGSHAEIFKLIGNYQVLSSRVFIGSDLGLGATRNATFAPGYRPSENRWMDILLQKKWE